MTNQELRALLTRAIQNGDTNVGQACLILLGTQTATTRERSLARRIVDAYVRKIRGY